MNNPFPFRDKLRENLLEAAEHRQTRRKRVQRTASVLAALAVLTASVLVGLELRPEPTIADVLAISRQGNMLNVTIKDIKAKPQQIEKELDAAGLNASVEAVPVSPSKEGTFVGYKRSNLALSYNSSTITLEDSPEAIVLKLGRSANADEVYAYSASAFARAEPLHCSGLRGESATRLADFASSLGLAIRWELRQGTSVSPAELSDIAQLAVVDALHTAPHELFVSVGDPNTPSALMTTDIAQDCD